MGDELRRIRKAGVCVPAGALPTLQRIILRESQIRGPLLPGERVSHRRRGGTADVAERAYPADGVGEAISAPAQLCQRELLGVPPALKRVHSAGLRRLPWVAALVTVCGVLGLLLRGEWLMALALAVACALMAPTPWGVSSCATCSRCCRCWRSALPWR